ncbi:MAG: hypothetical protein ABSC02_08760 [Acidobacteriota bacterium]|jgi:hypothetical protein
MKVRLQCGAGWLEVDVPALYVTVIEPRLVEGLPDRDDFPAHRNFRKLVMPEGSMTISYLMPED